MLWKECMLAEFYRVICQEETFLYLNGKNVLHPKTFDMVWLFISQDDKNFNLLRDNLCRFEYIFLCVYSIFYRT